MTERLKVHDWKSCRGGNLPRGFESLSLRQKFEWVVLGGALAVPCRPKSATCGAEFPTAAGPHGWMSPGREALRAGSCATGACEPRQVRKEAAVSNVSRVPQGCLA